LSDVNTCPECGAPTVDDYGEHLAGFGAFQVCEKGCGWEAGTQDPECPPFEPLTPEESAAVIADFNARRAARVTGNYSNRPPETITMDDIEKGVEAIRAERQRYLDELAHVAIAEKPDVILHALEVSCGAVAIGATSEELEEAIERVRSRA